MAQSRRAPASDKTKKVFKSDLDQMAARYVQARAALVGAGRALHDHIGSPLSAAGVQLQLLRMDVPQAAERIDETLRTLEETLNRVRDLSLELCPSPAYRGGLKQALLRLTEATGSSNSLNCNVAVEYSATIAVPAEIAAALYEAASAALEVALQNGAGRVDITARGAGPLVLRIADDGRKPGRTRWLRAIAALARQQGLAFECTTGRGTIVSIRYAVRRPSRG
jgi:signal transduction histidine kinase